MQRINPDLVVLSKSTARYQGWKTQSSMTDRLCLAFSKKDLSIFFAKSIHSPRFSNPQTWLISMGKICESIKSVVVLMPVYQN